MNRGYFIFLYEVKNYEAILSLAGYILPVSKGCVFPRTRIPRDACFPTHVSLDMRVSHQ